MSALRGGRATLVLLLCCVLLAGLVTAQLTDHTRANPAHPAGAPPGEPPEDPVQPVYTSYDPPPRAAFNEILERPLFLQGRRPPETPQPMKTVAPPVVRLNLRLLGVAMTQDTQVALVRNLDNNELLRLTQGEQHQGWTVASVEAGLAVLKRDELIVELNLEVD